MKPPTSKISHVDLVVSSIARSLRFYRGLLEPIGWSGLREVRGEQGETIYYLSVEGPGVAALRLTRETLFASTLARAKSFIPAGPLSIRAPCSRSHCARSHDPDGIKLELLHRPTHWEWLGSSSTSP